jgi:hypothetical protein
MDPEGRVSAHCTERHLSCRAHGAPGRVRGSTAALGSCGAERLGFNPEP